MRRRTGGPDKQEQRARAAYIRRDDAAEVAIVPLDQESEGATPTNCAVKGQESSHGALWGGLEDGASVVPKKLPSAS